MRNAGRFIGLVESRDHRTTEYYNNACSLTSKTSVNFILQLGGAMIIPIMMVVLSILINQTIL